MNHFTKAIFVLFGRDKETPGDRAFRHERERIISSMFLQAVPYLCLILAMTLLLGSVSLAIQSGIYSLIVFILLSFLLNAYLKWHQNKYGGD